MRIALLLLLVPVSLFAHPGHPAGPLSGLWHPFSGIDHVLVMMAVGFAAMRLGGTMRFAAPAVFLSAMAAGFLNSTASSSIELMIQVSLIGFALILASGVKLSSFAFVPLVVFAGFFHGAAHAEGGSSIAYAAGFLMATAGLHALGLALGAMPARKWTAGILAAAMTAAAFAG